MLRDHYDLVCIGAGPAGQSAAELATQFGRRALVVERQTLGGVVVTNAGIPTKTPREIALHITGFRERDLYGLSFNEEPRVLLEYLRTRTRDVATQVQAKVRSSFEAHGIDVIYGTARLAPPGEWRLWIRRGRCSVCRRTHALLPDLVLVRRLDAVEVIGHGLAPKVIQGLGLRSVAEQFGVPHTTARTWWRRFRARAPTLLATCLALAVQLAGISVQLAAGHQQAALMPPFANGLQQLFDQSAATSACVGTAADSASHRASADFALTAEKVSQIGVTAISATILISNSHVLGRPPAGRGRIS